MRIAIGGVQHETNTFAPQKATFEEFLAADAWPGLTRGPALFEAVRGINLPAACFIDEARAAGHTLLPLTWCSATPSAQVTRDAYERIAAMLIEDLRACRNLDAVYLDLHGAMAAEHIDDADGELLRRVREVVGPRTPVIASLDFHANVSTLMVEQASALVAYRTYPHLREIASAPRLRGRPIILADTQDNPGGGGTAGATSLIKALMARQREHHDESVLAGVICDPIAAARAHEAGTGAQIDLLLSAQANVPGETPIQARFTVAALGDGRFTATGPFYLGARMELGPMALLKIGDVHIAVASRKQQAANQAMFRHLRVEPRDFAILALKSSVHFRADFGSIASRVMIVEAPGPQIADPARLPFTRLPPHMRLSPRR